MGRLSPLAYALVRAGDETATVPAGAYGFRITGMEGGRGLVPAPVGWPLVNVVFREGTGPRREMFVSESEGRCPLGQGCEFVADRGRRLAVYTSPLPISPDEMVHPFLSPAAAMFGWWEGYNIFHASAFVAAGGVWALLGDKEAGKSSTVAWLNRCGYGIVADDLLMVSGETAYAGPRCIDLRPDASRLLDEGRLLDVDGPRERWRVTLPPVEPELPLRGWLILSWADKVELTALGAADRLRLLASHRILRSKLPDPASMLHLAALPTWELRRPRHWSSLSSSADLVLEAVARSEA